MSNIDDIFSDLILDIDSDLDINEKDESQIKISKENPLEMFNKFIVNCRKLCKDKFGDIESCGDIILNMRKFCKKINNDNLSDAKEIFKIIPKVIQCMYIQTSDFILSNKDFFTKKSYKTAFNIFNLFKLKEDKKEEVYSYLLEKFIKNDIKPNSSKKKTSKTKSTETKTYKTKSSKSSTPKDKNDDKVSKYPKKYQKYKEIDDKDPLYIFYYSSYSENPESRLAITWLTEHGIFSSSKREELESKYIKLKEKNLLIK
jgi:hypothetical protein